MDGMPSVPFDPFEWRKLSIKTLCDFLFSQYNCRTLSQSELKGYHEIKAKFSNGWRVSGNESYPKINVVSLLPVQDTRANEKYRGHVVAKAFSQRRQSS